MGDHSRDITYVRPRALETKMIKGGRLLFLDERLNVPVEPNFRGGSWSPPDVHSVRECHIPTSPYQRLWQSCDYDYDPFMWARSWWSSSYQDWSWHTVGWDQYENANSKWYEPVPHPLNHWEPADNTCFYCAICNMGLRSRTQYTDHLIGKKHARHLEELRASKWEKEALTPAEEHKEERQQELARNKAAKRQKQKEKKVSNGTYDALVLSKIRRKFSGAV